MRTLCPEPVDRPGGVVEYCNRPVYALDMCLGHLNEALDEEDGR